jgi:hypothetical protein
MGYLGRTRRHVEFLAHPPTMNVPPPLFRTLEQTGITFDHPDVQEARRRSTNGIPSISTLRLADRHQARVFAEQPFPLRVLRGQRAAYHIEVEGREATQRDQREAIDAILTLDSAELFEEVRRGTGLAVLRRAHPVGTGTKAT